jgi:zinc-binding alcohol dehydrogenase/oxidoreductase
MLVPGAGGGTAATCVQLAHALGARVIATSRGAGKREKLKRIGAELALDSAAVAAQARAATGGAGVDLVIESVGRPTWAESIAALRRGGRLVIYGSTGGDVVEFNLVPFFLSWQSVLGTAMGHAGEFAAMLAFVERRRLGHEIGGLSRAVASMEALHEATTEATMPSSCSWLGRRKTSC